MVACLGQMGNNAHRAARHSLPFNGERLTSLLGPRRPLEGLTHAAAGLDPDGVDLRACARAPPRRRLEQEAPPRLQPARTISISSTVSKEPRPGSIRPPRTSQAIPRVGRNRGGRRALVVCSKAYAKARRRASEKARPMNVIPTGSASKAKPAGTGIRG